MGVVELFSNFRWQDAVDITLVAILIYWVMNLIRGTRAAAMLLGLLIVWGLYFVAQRLEIFTTYTILQLLLSQILLIIVVIFQSDIRRALTQVGSGAFFSARERREQSQALEELTKAVVTLASRRIGALIVLQREVGLNEYIEVGTLLDAQVSKELITSIFMPSSPIHDGALIIQHGRITAAGCFLPLTANPDVSRSLGTRHRAAIGLTEETDAVVVVVSEEEGTISIVRQGRITPGIDGGTLRASLQRLLLP
jgi:uncharacterized protein (TIGR00159 family)